MLAADGRLAVFDTTATNIAGPDVNGPIRDVVSFDLRSGRALLISEGGNGPSSNPAASVNGQAVAFVSEASSLWAEDVNGVADVFYRLGTEPSRPVSVSSSGGPANGPSWDPDISANGRHVVFTSAASNLVPRDRNRQADVFLHDVIDGETTRVSVSSRGREASGSSGAPAISPDGRFVSFASYASNLVPRDTNRAGDVFVRAVGSARIRRVSVASTGRQQNKAVARPFMQLSDLSGDGRYVVFDSEATNLVRRDANRRADVFLHDRSTGDTKLVSASSTNRQGNNDSVAPAISRNARYVAFQSFASNLAPGNVAGEDVFVRDRRLAATSIVNVPANGGRRMPELVKQLLQRPAISDRGTRVAFTSTAPGLVARDKNQFEDVFVRLLTPPRTLSTGKPTASPRPSVVVTADDPAATDFICKIDQGRRFLCPRGRVLLRAGLEPGRHVLGVRAGGIGMAFDPIGVKVPIVVNRGR